MSHKDNFKIRQPSVVRTLGQQFQGVLNQMSIVQLASVVLVCAVIIQLPLVFNPGYFSHDEIQWAARANVSSFGELPWESWTAVGIYQFRPLTFNLWLTVSYFLFDYPVLFHFLLVVWASFNAALLAVIARHYQLTPVTVFIGVLLFVMSPYAMYVHGWVGTMADMLVMNALLLLVLMVLHSTRLIVVASMTALITAIALTSKESALAIPAILAVIWLFDERKTHWLVACLVAGLMAVVYLGLRLPVLLQQPEDTHYTLSLWNTPMRWLEYHLYWIIPNTEEPNTVLNRGWRSTIVVAGLLILGMWVVMWHSSRKLFGAMLVGGIATLAPVLPIASSAGQYGYLFAAWCVMMMASVWTYASRKGRIFIAFLALLSCLHGLEVMSMMRYVGKIQAVFSPALAATVEQSEHDKPIRLLISPDSSKWVFLRLTHDIQRYQGVTISERIQVVQAGQDADFLIQADGQITPIVSKDEQ